MKTTSQNENEEKNSDQAFCRGAKAGLLQLGVAGEGNLRWAVVDLGSPVEEMRRRLDLSPVAAVAAGRSLAAAALLLRFSVKTAGTLRLEIDGGGPLGKILAEVNDKGFLRGLVAAPQLGMSPEGRLDVGWAVGQEGLLRVLRTSQGGNYSSQTALTTGEIGDDLVHFLEQSQQIRSAALLGVLPRSTGIAEAGGVLIEAFPGAPDEYITRLEENIGRMDGVGAVLEAGGTEGLLDALLGGMDRELFESHELSYGCGEGWEAFREKVGTLSSADLDEIAEDDGRIVAECDFCSRQFVFQRDDFLVSN